jgi:YidC/Oxa1 family membrane protein insertase
MEKRLFLAIALSLLILLSWSAFISKTQHIDNKAVTDKIVSAQSVTSPAVLPVSSVVIPEEKPLRPTEVLKFSSGSMELSFDEQRAAIIEVLFKDNRHYTFPLRSGFLTDDGSLRFKKINSTDNSISFSYQDQNKRIVKTFTFTKPSYTIELQINVENLSPAPINVPNMLLLGIANQAGQNQQARYQDVFLVNNDKSLHLSLGKSHRLDSVKTLGYRDQYFCAIVSPVEGTFTGYIKKNNNVSEIGLSANDVSLNAGTQIGHSYRIYLGPQELAAINKANPNWSGIIHFGTFDFIAQLILQLLGFFYGIVHNWGWAIVILSLAVYALLFPLSLKQMRSMKEMQVLQPKIEALRVEYKDNPQKLNKEIMELYKEHKVNPLGGCLPLLLQMPIFFALYQALMRSVALRGAKFLWIQDLSEPDRLFRFSKSIPFLGSDVNILPILMAIGMFVQQKISMSKSGGAAAEQQKMMLVIMPVIFGVIFYNMPSGLVLYWFVNSALMLFYQFKIYRNA